MFFAYKGESAFVHYYWDINHWIQPTREEVKKLTDKDISSDYGYFPYFRMFSISTWILYGIILALYKMSIWFDKHLTINLK